MPLLLGILLDKVGFRTLRTSLASRLIPARECAFWVFAASVEYPALARSLLSDLTLAILYRAGNSYCRRFGVFAFGIILARYEFSEPSVPVSKPPPAFGAFGTDQLGFPG